LFWGSKKAGKPNLGGLEWAIAIRYKWEWQFCHGGIRRLTPGQMIKAVSVALEVPEETVAQIDRVLVVAGLRTKGGRGPSAPHVTHRDAARLIAAVMGSVMVKDSASMVSSLEATTKSSEMSSGLPPPKLVSLHRLSKGRHTFVDGLAALIEDADTPEMFENFQEFTRLFAGITVSVTSPGTDALIHGAIPFWTIRYHERGHRMAKTEVGLFDLDFFPLHQRREMHGISLMILGLCFQKGPVLSVDAAYRAWKARPGGRGQR
jgi:hypothetical protein